MTQHVGIRTEHGYTLVEILLVIVIVGILGALTLNGLTGFREKGRDTARIADLEKISFAVDRYYEACREYPAMLTGSTSNGCPSGTTFATYLPDVPTDPMGVSYTYSTSGAGSGYDAYVARAELERNHAVLGDDIDGNTHDGVSLACTDTPQRYYCVGS